MFYFRTTSDSFKSDNRTIELSDCSTISYLEHVTIDIDFSYDQKRGVTVLYLLSPSGTESHLLHSRYNDVVQFSTAGSLSWTFMSVHFWGENPIGTWTLKFKSHLGLSTGKNIIYLKMIFTFQKDLIFDCFNEVKSQYRSL